MNDVNGVYQNGKVVLQESVAWPDGTRVRVVAQLNGCAPDDDEKIGMDEDEWPRTPEGIEALMKSWDEGEPPVLTPNDEAEIAAARQAVRDVTIAAVRKKMGLDG